MYMILKLDANGCGHVCTKTAGDMVRPAFVREGEQPCCFDTVADARAALTASLRVQFRDPTPKQSEKYLAPFYLLPLEVTA